MNNEYRLIFGSKVEDFIRDLMECYVRGNFTLDEYLDVMEVICAKNKTN